MWNQPHNDYQYIATVNPEVVNDDLDTFPPDSICPRSPVGPVTTTGGRINDQGCGGKMYRDGYGLPIEVDVIVK
jgi:hypothetical protein